MLKTTKGHFWTDVSQPAYNETVLMRFCRYLTWCIFMITLAKKFDQLIMPFLRLRKIETNDSFLQILANVRQVGKQI